MSGMLGAAASQYLVGDYVEHRKTLGFTGCNAMFGTCAPSAHDMLMP